MSIRARVTLVGVGITTLVICCLSSTLFGLISGSLDLSRDDELAARADEVVAALAVAPATSFEPDPALMAIDPGVSVDVFVIVLDGDGRVLYSTAPSVTIPAAVLRAEGAATVEDVRVVVRPWTRTDIDLAGYAVAGQASNRIQKDRAGLVALFVVSGLITFVAAVLAVWVATGRALRPLRQMAGLADEVGRSRDLGRRLPVPSSSVKDVAHRLATSFNTMMSRLQEAYAAQQRFTADASHELRTPLTTIRNNAEFLLQHPAAREEDREAALRDIAGESVRMSRLIDNLLTLARADSGLVLQRVPVDLVTLAASVCQKASTLHPTRTISFAGTPAPPVLGDEDMLTQLLWILLDNAVKFTGAGGRVWVTVTQRGAVVQLTIADDGIGLPLGETDRLFERFYRASPSRNGQGAGLGLAIADWIVREHAGTIVAANNERGGATFSVDLPS